MEKISRGMKHLAGENDANVCMVCLAQLSRAVEIRGGAKRPMLSDLRDSGSLEQDADNIMFLYRPDYYNITEDAEGNSVKRMVEVIIAKNRHVSDGTGTVMLKYDPIHNRMHNVFDEVEDKEVEFSPNINRIDPTGFDPKEEVPF